MINSNDLLTGIFFYEIMFFLKIKLLSLQNLTNTFI